MSREQRIDNRAQSTEHSKGQADFRAGTPFTQTIAKSNADSQSNLIINDQQLDG